MKSVPDDPDKADFSLPEFADINYDTFLEVYPTWVLWVATDRKFLPTDLRKQPYDLMDNILYLDSLFEKMVGQVRQRARQQEKES